MASLTSILGGSLADTAKGLIEEFHMSPEQKAEMQQAIDANKAAFAQKELDSNEKLNQIASDNIKVETSSSDAFVRRARPAFLWAMTFAITLNLFLPLINQFFGGHMQPLSIDAGTYGLFSSAFLGYTISRTYEKANDKD